MIFPGSRYSGSAIQQVSTSSGATANALTIPLPGKPLVQGFFRRTQGQRLDLIAANYLKDATALWRLCDANDAMVPDALAARELIGIPTGGQ